MIGQYVKNALAPALFLTAVAVLVVIHCAGCKPAENPRAHARAVVVTLAEGVAVADLACASIARAKMDAPLARECAFARDEARESLIAAEDALDATDSAKAGGVPCMVAQAVTSASRLMGLIEKAGGRVPNALHDAMDLAPMLAGSCHG
jgi:hypothetical protein